MDPYSEISSNRSLHTRISGAKASAQTSWKKKNRFLWMPCFADIAYPSLKKKNTFSACDASLPKFLILEKNNSFSTSDASLPSFPCPVVIPTAITIPPNANESGMELRLSPAYIQIK